MGQGSGKRLVPAPTGDLAFAAGGGACEALGWAVAGVGCDVGFATGGWAFGAGFAEAFAAVAVSDAASLAADPPEVIPKERRLKL
mmetsp:Transcript_128706/g.305402  ORF Transcript_128706/g.305402 Transcript_128706/m.305402 type:complete len:85 (-) Transcript_128706:68-322(-)